MVSSRFRSITEPYIAILARPLSKMGLNPGVITLMGLGFSVIAALMYSTHNLIFASIALIISSVLDVIDGAVARLTKKVTPFGGFLDSLTDRYSDAIILIGIAMYLEDHYILVLVALVGSLLVSYTRARAEKEIEKCDVGFGERAERLIILIAATIFQALKIGGIDFIYLALVLLAFITHLTVVQRIWFTYRELSE